MHDDASVARTTSSTAYSLQTRPALFPLRHASTLPQVAVLCTVNNHTPYEQVQLLA